MVVPYTQEFLTKDTFLREFSDSVNEDELTWHRDEHNRQVKVLSGSGWKFQTENSLPVDLKEGDEFFIPKDSWHRLHLGKTSLLLFIKES
jgi:quercetin dioxygenase-like cupin family protein